MIRLAATLGLAALVAACGADGAPTPPPAKPDNTVTSRDGSSSLSISGDARVGVVSKL
ncbi:argininosuccinate lyase [Acidimangrovimonas sediminis]|uniref:argininosuccinate lyase n=1 Tax=Acidimangrovimonas sediminis TaxID=2056283 RepID=UPI000C80720B|nr:argininosuccinate lyase [Acidimangrovimonas sediminis]